ncbi:hypothetical protein PGT21_016396 [Puccinia graminis f. sp. tritici]|uniref:Uncharacterized protein n=1 Tax=Puccinia graminis f. sp. tritici TaxID=56615 RepID=A0A5B0N210_PUCGR|nr:hypothetical protein PGTUg99_012939 [Puccinia graminis f. sp. tritici]KAA1094283.1 hypothetical protein PGT21_016396 [Puccinia graminis f. sp. tritici]
MEEGDDHSNTYSIYPELSELPNMDYSLDGPAEDEHPIQVINTDENQPAKPQGVQDPDEIDPTDDGALKGLNKIKEFLLDFLKKTQ